ncbi:MAG TPA: hypothetical protein VK524_14545 [Polyangiaceae bacterium]|nr:hypothetical protein [Polyangiaceae bacterium]
MPSFLVTRRMSPELAARVQASVEGRRAAPGRALAPRSISVLRLTVFAVMVCALVGFFVVRERADQQLERDRAALLERVRRYSRALSPTEKSTAARVVPWLTRAAGSYEGDFVAPELQSPGALTIELARAAVYVRGPLASFNGFDSIRDRAAASSKDAFVLCLVDPPASRTEKLVRAKARGSYAAASMRRTAHVQRLYDAFAGLPFFALEWQARVLAADRLQLEKLQRNFEMAPLEGAKHAAKAQRLLFVIDEPASNQVPAELDGERPHHVRVGLVDLATGKPLLSLRRSVDPSWVSEATRAQYASAVDSCTLALDVHAAVLSARSAALGASSG